MNIMNGFRNIDKLEGDKPIYVVQEGHCFLLLPPCDRSTCIYDIIKNYIDDKVYQKTMKSWKPKEKNMFLATYDFEFVN